MRLPGAPDRDSFWRLLADGRCAIGRIPDDRFAVDSFHHPKAGGGVPGRSYTFAAGVIDDIWGFDPAVFGISPREAEQIDPQQRHLLEVTYEAIEHAGLRPSQLAGSGTGVYVGASSSDHATRFMFDPAAVDVHMMTGNTLSLISNRISYIFDLHGPSFTVDTACSSSLVAMHVALEAIRSGKIDTAIVGGVNMLLAPFSFIGFARASMLSPSGLCKAFDASGDGYVRAEGAVTLVLRAEEAARRNGDRIHALVVGSGINQDGRTAGPSLPSSDSQAALLQQVYEDSGVAAEDLAFIEAHGTGTRVGDPAEAHALGKVLGQRRIDPLPIGSVKTNIGHLEPASGLAGVVKSIMALERDVFPASLHFVTPNPDIDFAGLNIAVAGTSVPLPRARRLRHAGVNSFGFGGANAHVVLREAKRPAAPASAATAGHAPLVISAHSEGALRALAGRYRDAVSEDAAALAASAAHARDLLPHRLAIAGGDARGALAAYASGQPSDGVFTAAALGNDLDVAFVFSGNGSQWAGMGRAAYAGDRVFRAALDRFDTAFRRICGWSAVESLHAADLTAEIRKAGTAQPLLLGLQIATVEALAERGIRPCVAFGHSVGEIAAAWCAGALDLDGAIRVVQARSRRQEVTRHAGGMAAVLVSAAEMQALLSRGAFRGLEIAAVNSARGITVAGPNAVVDAFVGFAEQERWRAKRLDLDYPFHCALVDSIEPGLLADLEGLAPSATRIPFVSTVTGGELAGGELGPRYWWRNVRHCVEFKDAVDLVCGRGIRVFLEIGPHPVLAGYLHDGLREHNLQGAVMPTLGRESAERGDEISSAAARVLVAGGRVDLAAFVAPKPAQAAILPNYPWQHRTLRIAPTPEALSAFSAPAHPFLGHAPRGESGPWFSSIDPAVFPWLEDHRVEGAAVFPGAGFIEIGLAAAREIFGNVPLELANLEVLQPLVFDAAHSMEVMTQLSPETQTLELKSRARGERGEWQLNAKVNIAAAPAAPDTDSECDAPAIATMDAARVYAIAQRRGFAYGPAFQRVQSVELHADGTARARLNGEPPKSDRFVLDPTALDAAFHLLFALTEDDPLIPPDALLLPVRAGSLRVYRPGEAPAQATVRIVSATPRSLVTDITLADARGRPIAVLRQARCRVAPRAVAEAKDNLVYRTGFLRTPRPGTASALSVLKGEALARALADAAARGQGEAEARDVALVLDAGARAVAYETVQAITGKAPTFVVADLVASERLAASAWPLMTQMLLALFDAGLAQENESGWTLLPMSDMADVPDLVDLLLSRYPAWVAEAACLSRLPERLPALLRDGLPDNERLAGPLFEHLEYGSPAARRAVDILLDAAAGILDRAGHDGPLRVLIVGAGYLGLAARLAPLVESRHGSLVVTDLQADRLETARVDAFDAFRHVRVAPWERATDPAAGAYDLILCPRTLHRVAATPGRLDMLTQMLQDGGALLALEPAPALFADLLYGQSPAWWAQSLNPDFPTGALLSQRDWLEVLQEAGLTDARIQPLDPVGFLISAVGHQKESVPLAAPDINTRSIVVVADASMDSHSLADLMQSRLEGAAAVVPFRLDDGRPRMSRRIRVVDLQDAATAAEILRTPDSRSPVTDVVFLAAARRQPERPVAAISRQSLAAIQLARALAEEGQARLWIVCSGALSGIVDAAAPNPAQAALWNVTRVLQNEFAQLQVRALDLDPSMSLDAAATRLVEAIVTPPAEHELRLEANAQSALRIKRGGLPRPADDAGTERTPQLGFAQSGMFDSFAWTPSMRPALQQDDIEIEVRASGLNFRDVMWSLGLLPDEALENGFTGPAIGMECAGTVSRVGAGVTAFRPGDRVVAFAAQAFAAHVVVHCRMAARIPDEISLPAAATIPVAFLTAYYALSHLARLQAGETVLIHGGAGGVGLAALQIARLKGAQVIATAGTPDRRALLRNLGAAHVFDSRSLAFADEIWAATGGVDVVLNSLAGEAMLRSIDCLKPFGRFLELGKRDFYMNRHVGLRPFRNNLSYFGIDADQLLVAHDSLVQSLFAELMALFDGGQLVPLPYRLFPAEQTSDAFRLMQRSGHIGKILIAPPQARPRTAASRHFQPQPDATYLVVGGLGGLGLATAQWLSDKGARRLVLLGRSAAVSAETAAVLAALRGRGVRVDLEAVDVADRDALERCLDRVNESHAPLKGVFHVAMVIDDALARDLNQSRIEAVLRPKVQGAANLDALTRRFDLDCFVLFSSVASMVGNVGQANYVAANSYLDALARKRRVEGLPALAVAFGAVGDAGYLARNAAANSALTQRLGRSTLTAREALEGLDTLLACDPREVEGAAVGFARLDWTLARKELAVLRTPLFDDLLLEDPAGEGASLEAAELLRQLRELPDAEVEQRLSDIIAESITRTLRLPAGEVDRHRAMSEFGMDSLMMLELRASVEERMGIEIPLMSLTSSLTVTEIGKRLTVMLRNRDKAQIPSQMTVLAQGHVDIPQTATEAEMVATATALARRAKAVDRIL